MENYNENSKIFTSYKFEKYLKNPAELNYFCKYSKFIGFNTRKIFGTLIEFVGNSSAIFSIENIIQYNFAFIFESFHT